MGNMRNAGNLFRVCYGLKIPIRADLFRGVHYYRAFIFNTLFNIGQKFLKNFFIS